MPLITRTLTNVGDPLCAPDGAPLVNQQVTFTLVNTAGTPTDAWDAVTGERVVGVVAAVTNSLGEFSVNLWPNNRGDSKTQYLCSLNLNGVRDVRASVDEGAGALTWLAFRAAGSPVTAVELTALGVHLANPSGAHAASAISNFAATVRATVLTGLSTAAATVVDATHTVLQALGFLQKQVSDLGTSKQATLVSGTNIKTVNGTTLLGAGDLSIASGGSPGGTNGQVQFNNAGAFGAGAATLDSAGRMTVPGGHTTGGGYWFNGFAATDVALVSSLNYGGHTGYSATVVTGDRVVTAPLRASKLSAAQGIYLSDGFTGDKLIEGFTSPPGFCAINNSQTIYVPLTASKFFIGVPTGSLSLGRNSNAAEINNGTDGIAADLRLRNLIGTGNLATGTVAKTTSYTVTLNDHVIEADAAAGAVVLTLPALAAVAPGQEYIAIKTDASANAVTFDANASETINGALTLATSTQYAALRIKANAAKTAWLTF